MLSSRQISETIAYVLTICAREGCDLRFVRTGGQSSSNGSYTLTVYGVDKHLQTVIGNAVATAKHAGAKELQAMVSLTLQEGLGEEPKPIDRRENIQDMMLQRIEMLFEKYDLEASRSDDAVGNAEALRSIAEALQAVGHPSRELTVGMYAAPAARLTDADSEKLTRSEGLIAWDAAKPDIDAQDMKAMESVGIRLVSDRYVPPQVAAELAPLLEERRELRRLVQSLLNCDSNADLIAALKSRLSETPRPPQEPPA
jgi:hypothetical protein